MKRFPVLCLLVLAGCATVQPARALSTPADYAKLGLQPDTIAPWEDGLRTDAGPGSYEWWYFDAHLDDGSTLVLVFFTKPLTDVNGPLQPALQYDLTTADGVKHAKTITFDPAQFSASKAHCDVRIGPNRFEGDLHTWHLDVHTDELDAQLTLVGEVKPWRPAAGVLAYGQKEDKYFAWLPAAPQGAVTGTVRVAGSEQKPVQGTGYHDHNWGNASLLELIHDWYWGRARVGDYSVIASFITSDQKYTSTQFPILLLARGDEVLAGDSSHVRFERDAVATDPVTGKPVGSRLTWTYDDQGKQYRITFERRRDLVHAPLADGLPGFQRFLARLAGFDGAYHRFTGDVTVEALENGVVKDRQTNATAVWELMYLGH